MRNPFESLNGTKVMYFLHPVMYLAGETMDALYGVPLERGKCAGCCMRLVFGVAHGHNRCLQQARKPTKAAF